MPFLRQLAWVSVLLCLSLALSDVLGVPRVSAFAVVSRVSSDRRIQSPPLCITAPLIGDPRLSTDSGRLPQSLASPSSSADSPATGKAQASLGSTMKHGQTAVLSNAPAALLSLSETTAAASLPPTERTKPEECGAPPEAPHLSPPRSPGTCAALPSLSSEACGLQQKDAVTAKRHSFCAAARAQLDCPDVVWRLSPVGSSPEKEACDSAALRSRVAELLASISCIVRADRAAKGQGSTTLEDGVLFPFYLPRAFFLAAGTSCGNQNFPTERQSNGCGTGSSLGFSEQLEKQVQARDSEHSAGCVGPYWGRAGEAPLLPALVGQVCSEPVDGVYKEGTRSWRRSKRKMRRRLLLRKAIERRTRGEKPASKEE